MAVGALSDRMLAAPRSAGRDDADAIVCERSQTWATDIRLECHFKYFDSDEAVCRLPEAHRRQFLSLLAPWQPGVSHNYAEVTVHACEGDDCYVTLENLHAMSTDDSAFALLPVVERLRLPGVNSNELVRRLSSLGYTHPETADDHA